MKNIKILMLLFAAVSVGFSSCKKDDDDNNNAKIIGKWTLKKEVEKVFIGPSETESYEDTYQAGAYVDFKSNGTLEWNEDGSDPEMYSYKVDGNKLTITEEGDEPEIFTIEELTSSKLVISEEDVYTGGGQTYREVYQLFMER